MSSETLPDSGGAYFDVDDGGVIGIARRNIGSAFAEIRSGDAGATAVGIALGVVAVPAGKRLIRSMD